MTDIFREVEEELRHDHYAKLWRKYGKYVIALAVLIVAGTAGSVAWRDHQRAQRAEESERFAAGMMLIAENMNRCGSSTRTCIRPMWLWCR